MFCVEFAIGLEAFATVAIYSCNLASIGKATHAEGTAGAHLTYIGRDTAEPVILCEHMPADPSQARTWMDRQERGDRANARLGDKIRLALPRELTPAERAGLVRDFVTDLGGGRVPWFAGIHQTGEDRGNPHAHVFIRDRDIDTGRRVLRLSDSSRDRQKAGLEPKAVDWVRERWEHACNAALAQAGHEARIDRRTLAAQGLDREATIHIGPRAQHIENNVQRPASKIRVDGKGREIDYPMIDAGRTRLERHAEIVDLNLEKAARSPDRATREKARFERDQRAKDRVLERELMTVSRRHTLERRRVRGDCRSRIQAIRDQERSERRAAMDGLRRSKVPALAGMRARHGADHRALAARDAGILKRLVLAMDFTGTTRRKRDAAKSALQATHRRERQTTAGTYRRDRKIALAAVMARYAPMRREAIVERDARLHAMSDRHRTAEQACDARRQAREAERDRDRSRLEIGLRFAAAKGADRPASPPRDQQRQGPSPGLT